LFTLLRECANAGMCINGGEFDPFPVDDAKVPPVERKS
jgi:hypothetical protein